ncbi:hypothetical protein IGI04_002641, partial [Brassica rapa subsp. trilocularis]
ISCFHSLRSDLSDPQLATLRPFRLQKAPPLCSLLNPDRNAFHSSKLLRLLLLALTSSFVFSFKSRSKRLLFLSDLPLKLYDKKKTAKTCFLAWIQINRIKRQRRYVATGLEPKFSRCVATELFRTSVRHQSMHSRQTFKCYLSKTVASSVYVFRYSKSSIKLRGLETAESSFFVERDRSKRFESEDGPKGPKTRLEAHPAIS